MQLGSRRRCPTCGADFGIRGFQVVRLGTVDSFDRVDCAIAAGRTERAQALTAGTLGRVESLTAELFVARMLLDQERRRAASLEQAKEELEGVLAHERIAAMADRAPEASEATSLPGSAERLPFLG